MNTPNTSKHGTQPVAAAPPRTLKRILLKLSGESLGDQGTGVSPPIVAQVAKELGILTVAVVTKPFQMEGGKRMQIAEHGIAELGKYVDSLITIPNEKLLAVLGGETTLLDAFRSANQVLQGAVQGIAELITRPGLINVDFADVNVLADPEIRQGIKDYSDWPTIPQLYVKGEFVGGCDIITEMTLSGELDQLFDDKGVAYNKDAANKIREANG